ncbi:hypothetical protein ABS642_21340 [Microbacterium sp. A8/3-1]|uniref:Copper amine oxidase catalytic domain-containing protein n=1 Tax=Microbacterium sp. A8/3-1 TaxID=3160749 RepID=A0AAU7VXC3_9MICO
MRPLVIAGDSVLSTLLPRLEDWPIMPVDYAGFWLKPYGFLDQNPAMDVPESSQAHGANSSRVPRRRKHVHLRALSAFTGAFAP